ncbi:helix-turn-helix transcriptional regulator [Maritimibacter sp. DP1N21-5]|uniref:ArsR/SmtB family transcription factor n=1 Tax=Maritimibacter sp. DP1N21-5 TaxID=2836867 RepID=UPI001C483E11|nr:helix-turn-helix domain-containing protein [Maritimibacter sp. DP1N21-5]MBV7408065.1 helix-turn-helix domain-containing protein [Maritimibacter sp. DP1N21-5]
MTIDERIAMNFRALAHPRRAAIFRLLTEDPEVGATYRSLQMASGLCDASLIHHLRDMERCGLIRRHRRGAEVAYRLESATFCRTVALAHSMATDARLSLANGPRAA